MTSDQNHLPARVVVGFADGRKAGAANVTDGSLTVVGRQVVPL
jgi:hypothetical protein